MRQRMLAHDIGHNVVQTQNISENNDVGFYRRLPSTHSQIGVCCGGRLLPRRSADPRLTLRRQHCVRADCSSAERPCLEMGQYPIADQPGRYDPGRGPEWDGACLGSLR